MWLFLLLFLWSPISATALGSSESPLTEDVSSLDDSGHNGAVPGMQDYGKVIRPIGKKQRNGTYDRCLQKCLLEAMLIAKQAEADALKKEKAELEESLRRLKENDLLKQRESTILLIGGNESAIALDDGMIVLSEDRNRWTKLQMKLPYSAEGSGAVSLNGEIYLMGGWKCPTCLYHLGRNLEWIRLANMNIKRTWITNSYMAWNGYIWVFGGQDNDQKPLKSVERYDPKHDKWTLMPSMNYPRLRGAVALWRDRVVITGGKVNKNPDQTSTMESFHLEDDRWRLLSNMSRPLHAHSLVSYKDNLIIMGGWNEDTINDVWEFSSHELKWEKLPSMRYPCDDLAGIILDNKVYAIGGRGLGETSLSHVQIFDGEYWLDGPSLPHSLDDMSAVIIPQYLADRLLAHRPE